MTTPWKENDPTSLLSARSAVRIALGPVPVEAAAGAATGAGGGGAAETDARLKPHDMQKRIPGGFWFAHCGHGGLAPTEGAGAGATAREAGGAATGAGGAATGGAAGAAGLGAANGSAIAAAAGFAGAIPCGGVWLGLNCLGAASRGSSAPQPRQNL